MSATAVGVAENRAVRFWDSTNGKKAVMAVTGAILFGFVLVHMLGNLQIYEGPEKLNAYGRFLRIEPILLWAARLILLGSTVLHVVACVQLALRKKRARPVAYSRREAIVSTYASRTMYWSGPIVLAFIIYHLLNFTLGVTGVPIYIEGDVYHNVVTSFQNPLISGWYIVSMLLLGLHLRHGVWSMFQTLGISHPKFTPLFQKAALVFAGVVVLGNVSIPISVLAGLVK